MPRGGHNRVNGGTVEGTRSLDVMKLARAGYLAEGRVGGWRWTYANGEHAAIGITGGDDAMTLRYRVQSWGDDEWRSVEQRIPIVWVPCRFGGVRPWFRCDCRSNDRYCGRWVAKLYGAGRLFACRHCYRLVYAVQRGNPLDRGHARLAKLYRRLGADYEGFGDPWPDKPKWMRRRTYDALLAQLEAAEEAHETAFSIGAARFLAPVGKIGAP